MKKREKRNPAKQGRITLKEIQQNFFRVQLILIVSLALFLGVAATLINLQFETRKRDQNLQNIAETIARSPLLAESENLEKSSAFLNEYLDSLKESLDDIDVISVVTSDNIRFYHSNEALIGTVYDGTLPDFEGTDKEYYVTSDQGPSGMQRRAYSAIYNSEGEYIGFVMAIMLMNQINAETLQTLGIYALITVTAILMELLISAELSGTIKKSLMGYEPDVFSAMYQIRDNILESLDEGIVAMNKEGEVQFANRAAENLLGTAKPDFQTLSLNNADILLDRVPIKENGEVVGEAAIIHNRAEYTKLMEDLAGTRYLIDSMRANNHDFTNKLHVILGLIQMEMYEEAVSYIENITIMQREMIGRIMKAVDEPAVAALLIGKTSRAAELNIRFVLREGCRYSAADRKLPSELLVTVIGNLIDNAFEAMNQGEEYDTSKELLFGIYSRPGAVLITVDDTGVGISEEDKKHIFDNGFSTKGSGRGTGLYQVKALVEEQGGTITVESQEGVGTSFAVSFSKKNGE